MRYKNIGFAKVDIDRHSRRGFPEVIFAPGKQAGQIEKIANALISAGQPLLITKAEEKIFSHLEKRFPKLKYNKTAKAIYLKTHHSSLKTQNSKPVLIVTAGTGDISVAEEAAVTLEVMGAKYKRLYDVGVAGIHRLLMNKAKLDKACVIIVVAGMDGVLASVVGGIVSRPVIAVPTSVGYGAHFKGIGPLLTMLNCCAPGVAVVNIDNGFGAGYFASLINKNYTAKTQNIRKNAE